MFVGSSDLDPARLRFVFEEAADQIDDEELSTESGRLELVEKFLCSPEDTDAQVTVRAVIVNQILDDDPPEVWATIQRLADAGLDRDRIISQVAMVMAEEMSLSLDNNTRFDNAAYIDALDGLPLPSADEIADRLLAAARRQPGITAGDHEAEVRAELGDEDGMVLERLVDQVLDMLAAGPLTRLPGDRTFVVPDLVDGATFTHRVSDVEKKLGVLTAGFDLGGLARFEAITIDSGDGSSFEAQPFSVEYGHVGWRGPDGWLDGFDDDQLLAFTVSTESLDDAFALIAATVAMRSIDESELDSSTDLVSAVRAAYEEAVAEPGLPVAGEDLAVGVLADQPDAFANPVLPLRDLAEAAGLELRGGLAADDEKIWRNDLFKRRFDLAGSMAHTTDDAITLGRALSTLDDPEAAVSDVRRALEQCADDAVLDILATVIVPGVLEPADEYEFGGADAPGRVFELVARALAVAKGPKERATANYLAAVLRERTSEPDKAEDHLRAADDALPRLGNVAERLAWYRFDRGDAQGAMKYWRQLEQMPEGADTIRPFLHSSAGGPKVGRNDPCWCGSGKKFKKCHLGEAQRPALPDRVGWLCRKATMWLEHARPEVRDEVYYLAEAWATGDPDGGDERPDDQAMSYALGDPIVIDCALHEGGAFALFLHQRGPLLPEDEQLLAASWLTVERSVHEVTAVEPGVSMTLRNLATGDELDVSERSASQQVSVGDRLCTRVVPDGVSNQIIGGVFFVRAGEEATVLDLCERRDGAEICAWAGAVAQPPQIQHAPGMADEMFDREAIQAVLDSLGDDASEAEVLEQLNEVMQQQATLTWLDESIPALGGLTPREAVSDPTQREQVERLLADFERMSRFDGLPEGFTPMSYDMDLLRRELGLD